MNIQTTRGYVAVFDEDVIRHYQQFLEHRRPTTRRRIPRPTSDEWSEFQEHFDNRRVELGSCGRPYGTPCAHEHACIRCPMLSINPKMLPRRDELEADLSVDADARSRRLARRNRGHRTDPYVPARQAKSGATGAPHEGRSIRESRYASHQSITTSRCPLADLDRVAVIL